MPSVGQFGKLRQALPKYLPGEGADMHLVNDKLVRLHAFPMSVSPLEGVWIDDLRGSMRAVRLEAGDRIRQEFVTAVQPELIARTGARLGDVPGVVPGAIGIELECFAPIKHYFNAAALRRPDAKVRSTGWQDLRPNRQPPGFFHTYQMDRARRKEDGYRIAVGERSLACGCSAGLRWNDVRAALFTLFLPCQPSGGDAMQDLPLVERARQDIIAA